MQRSAWLVTLWLAAVGLDAQAAGCPDPVGRIVSAQGEVLVRASPRASLQRVSLDDAICAESVVLSGARSRAQVVMRDGAVLRLAENSALSFAKYAPQRPWLLELLDGWLYFFSPRPIDLDLHTRYLNLGVRGTEFVVHAQRSKGTELWMIEGRVEARNPHGSVEVGAGETAAAQEGQAPVTGGLRIRPQDAVTWAVHYPPLIEARVPDTDPGASTLRAALEDYRKGRLSAAFRRLDTIPPERRSARFYNLLAGLLLTVGGVDEAKEALDKASQRYSRSATALALRAVIEVALNHHPQARVLAERAVATDPQSAVARVALSYVDQARFELNQARDNVKKATELSPDNALTWARLSELELSFGEHTKALAAAHKALALNPELARTHTVLGFAHLSALQVDAAGAEFETAIRLDQASPLPRLGLGLAKIKRGDLPAGLSELEIAVALDPLRSLSRSYLGKAYFEQFDDRLSAEQLTLAKALDPADPTPWLYDAIRKQTLNRPVEALQDLEQAIERNDNRAVYRSRLLLDEDLAARGVSLARIYTDLGFQQLAVAEATQSLAIDPANHSAHRLLSDTYVGQPRRQFARVSELLQAQLLQPINLNPVQPQLSVSNLNLVAGVGPAEVAFNEFNPLFERDKPQLFASGAIGNQDTWSDELVLSGLTGRMSYSVGQFHFETDGYRQNNDSQHDVYDAFAQLAITPELNTQVELRRRKTEQGDLRQNFDPEDDRLNLRQRADKKTVRLGARYAPSPTATSLLSIIHGKAKEEELEEDLEDLSEFASDKQGYLIEIQQRWQQNRWNLIGGLGTYEIDVDLDWNIDYVFTSLALASEFDVEHHNAYVYANANFPESLTWTLGLSYDHYRDSDVDLDDYSPKLGLQWQLSDNLRVRAAALQAVSGDAFFDQRIEPTQVAGFNQVFDDFNGITSEYYGLGIDAHITSDLNAGLEVSRRDLKVPIVNPFTSQRHAIIEDRREDIVGSYLYWTPLPRWALRTGYLFDRLERHPEGDTGVDDPTQVETSSVPIAVRFSQPSGLIAELGATYVHQEIGRSPSTNRREGTEKFVQLDSMIAYRLPKRRGIISLEIRNLLNKGFKYQDDGFLAPPQSSMRPMNPRFITDRLIVGSLILNF